MEWISVKDRLPEDEERVAVLYRWEDRKDLIKFIGSYMPYEKAWVNTLGKITITHWMPLPEPPRK